MVVDCAFSCPFASVLHRQSTCRLCEWILRGRARSHRRWPASRTLEERMVYWRRAVCATRSKRLRETIGVGNRWCPLTWVVFANRSYDRWLSERHIIVDRRDVIDIVHSLPGILLSRHVTGDFVRTSGCRAHAYGFWPAETPPGVRAGVLSFRRSRRATVSMRAP